VQTGSFSARYSFKYALSVSGFLLKVRCFPGKSPRNAGNRAEIVVDAPLGGEEWGCSSAVKENCKSLHTLFAMYQQDAATG